MEKRYQEMFCPICGKEHKIELKEKIKTIKIKNQNVDYLELFYFCEHSDEYENEFVNGKLLNENLLRARDSYRKANDLLTSEEIKEIRKKYTLTQSELAKILDWGEVTITRYETKQIQDEAHDKILRLFMNDPNNAYDSLIKHRNIFNPERFSKLREKFILVIDECGTEAPAREILRTKYYRFETPSEENGYKILDIDKIEAMISFFAKNLKNLYKVKLMKLLWYSDVLSYLKTGHSMTGFVYCHEPMGALPIGHYELMSLNNVLYIEEYNDTDFENASFKILYNDKINYSFTDEELAILNRVVSKFINFTGKKISEYMHKETAYTQTKNNEIISFSWASELNQF